MLRFFAVAAPGIEPFVHQELSTLGISRLSISTKSSPRKNNEDDGGIEFQGELIDLYRANLYLRTASRVLVRLGSFHASAFSELRKKASRLPWENFVKPGQPVAVRATCHRSRLYHSDGVAERVAGAISDCLGKPSKLVKPGENESPPLQLVIVRLLHDHATISIDSSGELLHRRGYRLATAKAPLRETLAAAVLMASGWDRRSALIDPFCGSGTIPIEAALMARQIAPGKKRRFSFMDWPGFKADIWQSELEQANAREIPTSVPILASDRDAGAIQIAQGNTERAGCSGDIRFSCKPISAIDPPAQTGWIVTNPPYGVRLGSGHDLRNLYSQTGNVLRRSCRGWQAAVLCSSDYLIGHAHLGLIGKHSFVNGGIRVNLFSGLIRNR